MKKEHSMKLRSECFSKGEYREWNEKENWMHHYIYSAASLGLNNPEFMQMSRTM